MISKTQRRRGFTLLIAVLVVSIILAIGLSILTITLKEFILSGIARESALAFAAADAGMECAFYWDRSSEGNKFDVGAPVADIECMDETASVGAGESGSVQSFEFSWGAPAVCATVTVTKFFDAANPVLMGEGRTCPVGVECTRVRSLGYNVACDAIDEPRVVERGLRALY